MKNVKIAAMAICVSLVVVGAQGCALLYPHWGQSALPSDSANPSETSSASASPTETQSETPTASATPTEPAKNKAKVVITDFYVDEAAGVLDVIAEVTNVYEEGGTCALSVTSGTSSALVTAKAGQNVTDTQCGLLEVNLSDLNSGTASFRVSYTSPVSAGKSALTEVTIP